MSQAARALRPHHIMQSRESPRKPDQNGQDQGLKSLSRAKQQAYRELVEAHPGMDEASFSRQQVQKLLLIACPKNAGKLLGSLVAAGLAEQVTEGSKGARHAGVWIVSLAALEGGKKKMGGTTQINLGERTHFTGNANKMGNVTPLLLNKEYSSSTPRTSTGTSTARVGECADAYADAEMPVEQLDEDPTRDEALGLLAEVGIQAGQQGRTLDERARAWRRFPAVVAVRVAIADAKRLPSDKRAGCVRTALKEGYPRLIIAAEELSLAQRRKPTKSGQDDPQIMAPPTPKPKVATPQAERTAPSPESWEASLAWERIQECLSKLLEEASFKEWIKPLRPLRLSDDGRILQIEVPSPAAKLWVEQQLDDEFVEAIEKAGFGSLKIQFLLATERSV